MFDMNHSCAKDIIIEVLNAMTEGNSTKVLVPYNIANKHWVGMVFELEDDKVFINYFDPENNSAPQKLVRELTFFMNEFSITAEFKEIPVPTQTANNCGPEIIEDFIQYLTGERIKEEEVVPYHSQLLAG